MGQEGAAAPVEVQEEEIEEVEEEEEEPSSHSEAMSEYEEEALPGYDSSGYVDEASGDPMQYQSSSEEEEDDDESDDMFGDL